MHDPERLFAPASALNDVRRKLVESLDAGRDALRRSRADAAASALAQSPSGPAAEAPSVAKTLKMRPGQLVPPGEWDEVVVSVDAGFDESDLPDVDRQKIRLALPVYTPETEFNALRTTVRRLVRGGFAKWEASDLATLRLLSALGVSDMTADWTLYAFNSQALYVLSEAGVRRFVASPENSPENVRRLSESGYAVEFLARQSTPLFMSLAKPAVEGDRVGKSLAVFRRGGLWITTRTAPRTFDAPRGVPLRTDISWDPS